MRNTMQTSPKQLRDGEGYVTHSLTIRIGNKLSEKEMASIVNSRDITSHVFSKKTIKELDKRIPYPVDVVQAYADVLLTLEVRQKVPMVVAFN